MLLLNTKMYKVPLTHAYVAIVKCVAILFIPFDVCVPKDFQIIRFSNVLVLGAFTP